MTTMKRTLTFRALWLHMLGLLIVLPSSMEARTISWYSSIFDELYDSSGVYLDDSYTFDIGAFANGFVPTSTNMDQWAANWKPFDRAVVGDGWNSGVRYFTGSASLQSNGTSDSGIGAYTFSAGEVAYLWVYNSQAVSSSSEWALVTNSSLDGNSLDNWTFPAYDPLNPNPVEWALAGATEPIYGGVNNVQGAGEHTSSPSPFSLQTHAVPEPGGAFLIAAAGLLALTRRMRRSILGTRGETRH